MHKEFSDTHYYLVSNCYGTETHAQHHGSFVGKCMMGNNYRYKCLLLF